MRQEQGGKIGKIPWWYYMRFPFFGLFLVAKLLMCSPYYAVSLMRKNLVCFLKHIRKFFVQAIIWWFWWTRVFILQATYCAGALLLPIYTKILLYLDADFRPLRSKQTQKLQRHIRPDKHRLLTLAGRFCVFSNVCNVYGKDLVLLRQPMMYSHDSFVTKFINFWNLKRGDLGMSFPPSGWPLSCAMFLIAGLTTIIILTTGYVMILKRKMKSVRSRSDENVMQNVFQTIRKNDAKMHSQLFDTDSNTIIVDNFANCILWNQKSDFVKDSYISLQGASTTGITSATGQGVPIGIGTLELGWYDDSRKYHTYKLPNVYHVPTSPVNILGLSMFSKILGDYHAGGTRINSSGKDSIFTWNHGKFCRTFTHSESHMPELIVNDGFFKYHQLCHFIDKFHPTKIQCHHVHATKSKYKQLVPYSVGEEVVYKHNDHIEKRHN